MKAATLFSGFEGVGVGMRDAGLTHVWGIEYDDQIAAVARLNGFNTHTLNILDADPALFEAVDVLHASPPCPNFSVAKAGAEETETDIALARKVADFIEVLRPKYFTLENVYAYRNSQSWQIISNRLYACGYWADFQHVNFADYGVPQTRQRMIVRAVHNGFVPYLPKAEPWQGWYQAIEDLVPTLLPSQFAPWQLARLPEGIKETIMVSNQNDAPTGVENRAPRYYKYDEPSGPVLASTNQRWRAFIVDGKLSTSGVKKSLQIHTENEPSGTIVASHSTFRDTRAWLSRGTVVKMTPRSLARFQSFPDWYQLPEKSALACKGIGNAVPPLGMAKIYKGLV